MLCDEFNVCLWVTLNTEWNLMATIIRRTALKTIYCTDDEQRGCDHVTGWLAIVCEWRHVSVLNTLKL